MSEIAKRVLVSAVLILLGGLVALLQSYGLPAVRYAGVAVVLMMIIEMIICIRHTDRARIWQHGNWFLASVFLAWLCLMLVAIYGIGTRPWIVLLLLVTICAADIGAWFWGRVIGGDKMWERISANKTWSGQIGGIICGTLASILYGMIGTDVFMAQLLWIGISVSLLSQYGDLTASFIKRRLGFKDFGRILPGHGGVLDRFDGWIYVLPLVWWVLI